MLDGGAYARRRATCIANAACFAAGPVPGAERASSTAFARAHEQPAVRRDARLRRGAGRASRHEAQMDKLADALRHRPDRAAAAQRAGAGRRAPHRPAHHRRRAGRRGHPRVRRGSRCRRRRAADDDARAARAARAARPTRGDVRRGVGFAVGFKNLMYAEGFDDYSTARVPRSARRRRRRSRARRPRSARDSSRWPSRSPATVLGVDEVVAAARPTRRSARPARPRRSRQTRMSGGAVQACLRRRARRSLLERVAGIASARGRPATIVDGDGRRSTAGASSRWRERGRSR